MLSLPFSFNARSNGVKQSILKQAKCNNLTSENFALKRTSFSDAFVINTIRLQTTVVLHRSPPKDLNQENGSPTHFYWFKSPNFFFLLEFATDVFSLKIERWLKRLTLSWKFNDQKRLRNFM